MKCSVCNVNESWETGEQGFPFEIELWDRHRSTEERKILDSQIAGIIFFSRNSTSEIILFFEFAKISIF